MSHVFVSPEPEPNLVQENNQQLVTASSENSIKTARKMPLPQIPGIVTANLLDEPLNYALANDNY